MNGVRITPVAVQPPPLCAPLSHWCTHPSCTVIHILSSPLSLMVGPSFLPDEPALNSCTYHVKAQACHGIDIRTYSALLH